MLALDPVTLSRIQFAWVIAWHILLPAFTVGIASYIVLLEGLFLGTGREIYLRVSGFWTRIFAIAFGMGVVTGIVLEFQIGMNWSEYSRFVGDVFGAPLAMEALLAFFLEATFIGLWIFGWDRLPKGVHLACIWCVAIGTNLSAYFIITANSWMRSR